MKETLQWNKQNNKCSSREVLMKRHNVLKRILRRLRLVNVLRTRGDLDATRHLILHRISIRRVSTLAA